MDVVLGYTVKIFFDLDLINEYIYVEGINDKNATTLTKDEVKDIHISKSVSMAPKKKQSVQDYKLCHVLGKGTFGKVWLVKSHATGEEYALKMIDKKFVEKHEKVHEIHIEKRILSSLNHPNIIKIHATFQDAKRLYFLLEYASNRDLSEFLRVYGIIDYELAKFFTAEIVSAIDYLNSKGIVHRDLKPENIMLDSKMHLKLIDFSTSSIENMYFCKKDMKFKYYQDEDDLPETFSLVGTADYLSPEMLAQQPASISIDLWALGCILYLFFNGETPFKSNKHILDYNRFESFKIEMKKPVPEDAADLIEQLLKLKPNDRIGSGQRGSENDLQCLKNHKFFKGIDFSNLQLAQAPIKLSTVNTVVQSKLIRSKTQSRLPNIVNQIDLPGILIESIVQKKSPWIHYNTRILRLFAAGYLQYFEPAGNKLRGTIELTVDCKAVKEREDQFSLYTENRTFFFKLSQNIAQKWIDLINSLIQEKFI